MSKLENTQQKAVESTHRDVHDLAYETFHSEIFANHSLTDWSSKRVHLDATQAEAKLALKRGDRNDKSHK